MSRLTHPIEALARSLEISETPLTVFVEGKNSDRYFYGRLCARACRSRGITYRVSTSAEIPRDYAGRDDASSRPSGRACSERGGKKDLLKFFQYLHSNGRLNRNFKGKVISTVFYLDKDIDDLLGLQVESPNVIYTRLYDVEGHIFESGDLIRALAATASLDEAEVSDAIESPEAWRRSCAEEWKDWLAICIFCSKYKVKNVRGYRLHSQINNARTGMSDKEKHEKYVSTIQQSCGFDENEFKVRYEEIQGQVNSLLTNLSIGEVFKGKWYPFFAARAAKKIAGVRPLNIDSVHGGILGAMAATIDFDSESLDHFVEALESLFILNDLTM
jgi:hypothetical protein